MDIVLKPLGFVRNERKKVVDDYWGDLVSKIEFDASILEDDALAGIDAFSHVEIIFYMDKVNPKKIVTGARHPRNNPSLPKFGILAQRGKGRPNQLGVSFAEVVSYEGLILTVKGLDAVDDTPVLDVKPCFKEFLPRGDIIQPAWTHELMTHYYDDASEKK